MYFTFIANNYNPLIVDTIIDTCLFTQSVVSLLMARYFYGFQFLVFHRFLNFYFIETIRHVSNRVHFRTGTEVVLLYIQGLACLCLITGLVHTAEEWTSDGGTHADVEGGMATIRNYGEYFYFVTVTLSTVGYGDISPQTIFGRIVVFAIIIVCIPVFAATSERIISWFTDSLTRFTSSGTSLLFFK